MSRVLNIIINPNPILRKKSLNISQKEINIKEMQELYADMAKTMREKDGVGLAAPQIGKNIKLSVINTKDGPLVMLNPKLIKKSWAKEWDEEGCLSVPYTSGKVKRHKKVCCRYLDKKGQEKKIDAEGLLARVIQHELDHLDGILFIDKAKEIKKMNEHE